MNWLINNWALIVAAAACIAAVVTGVIKFKNLSREQQIEASISQKIALLNEKFDELTRKVEKHNGLVERTYKLESDVKLMQEKQSVANHRIDKKEKKGTA